MNHTARPWHDTDDQRRAYAEGYQDGLSGALHRINGRLVAYSTGYSDGRAKRPKSEDNDT